MAMAFIASIALAGGGIFFWFTSPQEIKFDPEHRAQYVEEQLANLTPAEGWAVWMSSYRNLSRIGFSEYRPPNVQEIERLRQLHSRYYKSLWTAAAVCLAMGMAMCWSIRR